MRTFKDAVKIAVSSGYKPIVSLLEHFKSLYGAEGKIEIAQYEGISLHKETHND